MPLPTEERADHPLPAFEPGTIVSAPSMVIDTHGVAWWVRPDNMLIIRVRREEIRGMKVCNDG